MVLLCKTISQGDLSIKAKNIEKFTIINILLPAKTPTLLCGCP